MTAREIADNAVLAVIARLSMLSMAPIFALTVWLGGQWLDGRFVDQALATAAVSERVRSIETDSLPTRLSVLENTILNKGIARDRQLDAITAEQIAQGARIDKLVDSIGTLSNELAGLTATLKAEERQPLH